MLKKQTDVKDNFTDQQEENRDKRYQKFLSEEFGLRGFEMFASVVWVFVTLLLLILTTFSALSAYVAESSKTNCQTTNIKPQILLKMSPLSLRQ